MMGYASVTQTTNSLWQRQWARAFVLSSAPPGTGARLRPDTTVAVVVVDACMTPSPTSRRPPSARFHRSPRARRWPTRPAGLPRRRQSLAGSFGASRNVRTISCPSTRRRSTRQTCACAPRIPTPHRGGTRRTRLYNVTFGGAVSESFRAQLDGVVDALIAAHDDAATRDETTRITLAKRRVPGVAVNRSPAAYARNPSEERDAHEGNVDDTLTVLAAFGNPEDEDEDVDVLCAMAWFAVHGTSLRRTNRSVSGDNKGVASWLAETALRGEGRAGASALETSFRASEDGRGGFRGGFRDVPRVLRAGARGGGDGRGRIHARGSRRARTRSGRRVSPGRVGRRLAERARRVAN